MQLISINPCQQEVIGIVLVEEDVLVPVGTAMETMAYINTSCRRTKLALGPTKINGRRKRRRRLVLAVTALEGNNMRGPCLVMVVVHKSHLEVVLKSLTTCGTCIVARVVNGTAPILQLSCRFHFKSIFLSLCLACHTSLSSKDCKRTMPSRTYSISSYCFFCSSFLHCSRQQ